MTASFICTDSRERNVRYPSSACFLFFPLSLSWDCAGRRGGGESGAGLGGVKIKPGRTAGLEEGGDRRRLFTNREERILYCAGVVDSIPSCACASRPLFICYYSSHSRCSLWPVHIGMEAMFLLGIRSLGLFTARSHWAGEAERSPLFQEHWGKGLICPH